MIIGDLDKRITFQYQTKVSDGMGGWIVTWNDAATVFAAIWPVSANEIIVANATSMVVTHRIQIWYRRDIKASYRIKFGNRYFAIVSIINKNEKNESLDIMAKEAA